MINDNNSRVLFGPINLIEYESIVGNKCFSLGKCLYQAPNLPSGILYDFWKMTELEDLRLGIDVLNDRYCG